MAVETKRGCGYRRVGNIYLVGENEKAPCDRLPIRLDICPVCGSGIKFSRGFTWINPVKLFGNHGPGCACSLGCPICYPDHEFIYTHEGPDGELVDSTVLAGLMWIGNLFYSAEDFRNEAVLLGISKRIKSIPHGFKIGKTWIFLAHQKIDFPIKVLTLSCEPNPSEPIPGIFMAFRPTAIERIVKQSEFDVWTKILSKNNGYISDDRAKELVESWMTKKKKDIVKRFHTDIKRGITLVPVPDDDPDHK